MDETKVFQCPHCGSALTYDAEKDRLACDKCLSTFDPEEVFDGEDPVTAATVEVTDEDVRTSDETESESTPVQAFHCEACGAEILTDENTTATFCSFCGSPNVMPAQMIGRFRPAKLIPFQISKVEATMAFRKWCRNGRFMPAHFASAHELEKMTGLYVPYWLFDASAVCSYRAHATNVRFYRLGNYEYTTTRRYAIRRAGSMTFEKIPADGSKRLDDHEMDLLEPYDYTRMVDFKMPYLSGFHAEKFDVSASDNLQRLKDRVAAFARGKIEETIGGYTTVSAENFTAKVQNVEAQYVLLPVWIHSYRYRGQTYRFLMNAQTGKVVGKPPLDKARLVLCFLGIALGLAALFFLGGMFLL